MNLPLNPKEVAQAAIAAGLLIPPAPIVDPVVVAAVRPVHAPRWNESVTAAAIEFLKLGKNPPYGAMKQLAAKHGVNRSSVSTRVKRMLEAGILGVQQATRSPNPAQTDALG